MCLKNSSLFFLHIFFTFIISCGDDKKSHFKLPSLFSNGIVVHFATDLAKRANISGEHSKCLDMLDDQSICPVIYDS